MNKNRPLPFSKSRDDCVGHRESVIGFETTCCKQGWLVNLPQYCRRELFQQGIPLVGDILRFFLECNGIGLKQDQVGEQDLFLTQQSFNTLCAAFIFQECQNGQGIKQILRLTQAPEPSSGGFVSFLAHSGAEARKSALSLR